MRGTSFSSGAGALRFGFQLTPWVKRLLIANVAVFLVTLPLSRMLVVDWLAFQPNRMLLRPWGVVTYMFVHADFWHIFMNMLMLFFFGPPLEGRWGSQEFIKYYMVCGLGGVALSFVFGPGAPIIGASAAVYGIMLAFAMVWPKAPIYVWGIFPVQARFLMAFLFLVTFTSAFGGGTGDGVAHFAHLGGLVVGFIYLKSDWRAGAQVDRVKRAAKRTLAIVPRDPDEKAEVGASRRGRADEKKERAMLDEVDRVLDKISAHGMSSLTKEEKQLLDDVSRRHRTN